MTFNLPYSFDINSIDCVFLNLGTSAYKNPTLIDSSMNIEMVNEIGRCIMNAYKPQFDTIANRLHYEVEVQNGKLFFKLNEKVKNQKILIRELETFLLETIQPRHNIFKLYSTHQKILNNK